MFSSLRRPKKAKTVARAASIEIQAPWARSSSDMPALAGGFLTLVNGGTEADRLIEATSPATGPIEIHAIRVKGSGIVMSRLENGLHLPHGTTLVLKPRGYHLLIQVDEPLAVGSQLPLTLTFERAGRVDISLDVEAPGPVGEQVLHVD